LDFARKNGVQMMTFDNLFELEKIKQYHPDSSLVLRVHTGESKAICKLGKKFGAYSEEVVGLLRRAKDLSLNVIGVSFHIGSGCTDASAFSDAIQISRDVFNKAENVGFEFSLLDVGGGFPGDPTAPVPLSDIAPVLNAALDNHFPESSGIRVIGEPGRYYVASSTTVAVTLVSKREFRAEEPGQPSTWSYYVNDGTYGTFNNVMYDHAEPIARPLIPELYSGDLFTTTIWGPTCDSMDCITRSAKLPSMPLGHWIAFENSGAYTVAAGSTFNGFPRPTSVYTFSCPVDFDASILPENFPIVPQVSQA
jgi:ornithine decarboxylase